MLNEIIRAILNKYDLEVDEKFVVESFGNNPYYFNKFGRLINRGGSELPFEVGRLACNVNLRVTKVRRENKTNYIKKYMLENNLLPEETFQIYYPGENEGMFCFVDKDNNGKCRLTKIVCGGIDTSHGYLEKTLLDLLDGTAKIHNPKAKGNASKVQKLKVKAAFLEFQKDEVEKNLSKIKDMIKRNEAKNNE